MEIDDSECKEDSGATRQSRVLLPTVKPTVKKKNKDTFEFNKLEQVQEFLVPGPKFSIWVLKVSPDNRLVSVAGENNVIYLLEVNSEFDVLPTKLLRESAPMMHEGHSNTVIDISWCLSSNFFLSASADTHALLWTVGTPAPIVDLKHKDLVSAVCFHPVNANYCLTACFDRIVRIWNVSEYQIVTYFQASGFITAGTFSPLGDKVLLGLKTGQCLLYDYDVHNQRLIQLTTLQCKNRHGFSSRGRPVTGLDFYGNHLFLVTTNDSRLRLYDINDFNCKQKYKGTENTMNPIKGSFSHDLAHLICGSDSGEVYIWNTFMSCPPKLNPNVSRKAKYKNNSVEWFHSTREKCTSIAIFAPHTLVAQVSAAFPVRHIILCAVKSTVKVFYNPVSS